MEALLSDVASVCGDDRPVCVGRELTKMHEEYVRGAAQEVRREFAGRDAVRGECVLVVGPAPEETEEAGDAEVDALIEAMLEAGCRSRTIKDVVSQVHDVARSEMYDRIDAVDEQRDD
jgi:16S rRNA (cytidine1402-2'-O)-methyltransferase